MQNYKPVCSVITLVTTSVGQSLKLRRSRGTLIVALSVPRRGKMQKKHAGLS